MHHALHGRANEPWLPGKYLMQHATQGVDVAPAVLPLYGVAAGESGLEPLEGVGQDGNPGPAAYLRCERGAWVARAAWAGGHRPGMVRRARQVPEASRRNQAALISVRQLRNDSRIPAARPVPAGQPLSQQRLRSYFAQVPAAVAELVDAPALGAGGVSPCGFESLRPHSPPPRPPRARCYNL